LEFVASRIKAVHEEKRAKTGWLGRITNYCLARKLISLQKKKKRKKKKKQKKIPIPKKVKLSHHYIFGDTILHSVYLSQCM
jgi:hypothetical protein